MSDLHLEWTEKERLQVMAHVEQQAAEIKRLRAALGHVDACIVCGQIDQARKAIRAALEGK